MKSITKNQLLEVIRNCTDGKSSPADLQKWMLFNYEPPEVIIGENEAQHTVEAMNIVMNEYELAVIDKYAEVGFNLALKFISCNESDFEMARNEFIRKGFTD
jgi:hypothetical protein